jgi:tRNA pseudouridine55 synthase
VLVIGIGEGCKQLSTYLSGPKSYRAIALLGEERDSLDITGTVVNTHEWRHISHQDLELALRDFRGTQEQIPPMHSALRVGGERLYEKARRGEIIPRASRTVHVGRLELVTTAEHWTSFVRRDVPGCFPGAIGPDDTGAPDPFVEEPCLPLPFFALHVECSGGTYIRTLISDIAQHERVRSGATMTWLERTQHGPFTVGDCLPMRDWNPEAIRLHAERSRARIPPQQAEP